ncbi:hypothetical protein M5689_013438 [Euphorbia peplus]|nr:hypothetical protein M5689_013438 [Euphorbia peplus]
MAVSLSRFSMWLWSGKEKGSVSNGFCTENDSVKFSTKNSASQKKKLQSMAEKRGDKQCGDAVSLEESDGPDWSIGWVEPHGIDFTSDDDGFAVLVPCYRHGCKELVDNSNNQLLCAIKNLPNEFSSEGNKCMEWLSSLGEN